MSRVANPILAGCYPDPTICRVADDYYLVTSTFEYFPGLPVFRSRDLVSWEQIGHVVDRADQLDYEGIASSGGLYAPTLRHHDGLFWLVCTLVDQQDATRGGNFLMTATDPAGPWSDPVWLDAGGIDPSIFFDDDGRVWVHGTRLAVDPQWHDQTEVWIRELDPAARTLVGPEHVVWTGAVTGAVWAEGPHLYKVEGRYYLLAAEGGTEMNHAISVARAESVTGPYEGNRRNPIFTHRTMGVTADVVGVGHGDLVQARDGSWWATVLGMRPYGGMHYNRGRETFLVPVSWEEGWPVFAPGVGRVTPEVEVPFAGPSGESVMGQEGLAGLAGLAGLVGLAGLPAMAGSGGGSPAGGVVSPWDLRWTSLRGPADDFASPRGEGWDLAMRPSTMLDATTPAFLGLRQQHRDVDLHATLRVALEAGEEVGLILRQSEDDHVRAFLTGARGEEGRRVVVVHRENGVETTLGETVLRADVGDDAPVRLSMRARGQDYAFLVSEPGGGGAAAGAATGTEEVTVAVADGRPLDSVSTGGFLGLWVGVYATSNGRPTSTIAHVDAVEYLPL